MVRAWKAVIVFLGVWAVAQPSFTTPVEAQLDPFFYLDTCPQAYIIVAKGVFDAIQNRTRSAAFLLRLHFHDCFVQGCDGSILLDSFGDFVSEQFSGPNNNSINGLDTITTIKASIESSCPGVVSCADILALSAFYSVVLSGGPFWLEPLGRRDSVTAPNTTAPTSTLPAPFGNFSVNLGKFTAVGLSEQDLVALSGAHTIGLSRCASFTNRLYAFNGTTGPDPTINSTLLSSLETSCPNGGDSTVTNFMDLQTPTVFDNLYYQNLLEGNGLFRTDQDLFDRGDNFTESLVQLYASNQSHFFEDFKTSIVNMGNISVLLGTDGEIRLNCSVANADSSFIQQVVQSDSESKSETPKTEANRQNLGKAGTLKRIEDAEVFVRQVLKLVAEEIAEEQRGWLVEDTLSVEQMVEESVSFGELF